MYANKTTPIQLLHKSISSTAEAQPQRRPLRHTSELTFTVQFTRKSPTRLADASRQRSGNYVETGEPGVLSSRSADAKVK
ncbi:hypothetical protein JTE90_009254 [Oedothorax gibbosus]|uniref:Uncharacterized protein n=1 Tax=Oedothorax gibbosus TaxID=931172 RepID=A0AAV6V1C7_9ARAC|nr:hypothetical protein JTE90_009254 [Oedothorax gibbosus]